MARDSRGNLIYGTNTGSALGQSMINQTPSGRSGDSYAGLMGAQTNAYSAQVNAALGLSGQQSSSAAERARMELSMAQNRVSPFADSIMQGARDSADQIDRRYSSAIGEIQGLGQQQINDYLAMTEGLGDASRERIYRDSQADHNSVGSALAGTGLYNSTVLGTLQMQVQRNRNEAIGQLDEGLRRERSQALMELTNRVLDRHTMLTQGQLGAMSDMAGRMLQTDAQMRGQQGTNASISQASLDAITAPSRSVKLPSGGGSIGAGYSAAPSYAALGRTGVRIM